MGSCVLPSSACWPRCRSGGCPFLMQPDMIFLLKINAEESLKRLTVRDELTKFEKAEFLQKVSDNYQYLADTEKGVCTINAAQPIAAKPFNGLKFTVKAEKEYNVATKETKAKPTIK